MTTTESALPLAPPISANVPTWSLPTFVGFFFAYRFALTFLGFQSNPRVGTMVNLSLMALLFAATLFQRTGGLQQAVTQIWNTRCVCWLLLYVAFSGASLFWTGADSALDAAGLWSGMALELFTVLLLLEPPNILQRTDALLKGFVLGMVFVDAVAWMSPTLDDLRIGDYDFLHPNIIGLYSAECFFLAQYLALKNSKWRWACLALAASMFRSLSKTSIIAFAVAEGFYLLRDKQISRATKFKIAAAAVALVGVFWVLFASYLEMYTTSGSGNQAETLTGRTAIWAVASLMAMETPWIGHGFYSLRALIPAFGTFEPWHAHNEMLQEFFEYGVVGVSITIAIYFTFVREARRLTKRLGHNTMSQLVFVLFVFAIVHGLTESINFGLTLPLWLFATISIGLSARREISL